MRKDYDLKCGDSDDMEKAIPRTTSRPETLSDIHWRYSRDIVGRKPTTKKTSTTDLIHAHAPCRYRELQQQCWFGAANRRSKSAKTKIKINPLKAIIGSKHFWPSGTTIVSFFFTSWWRAVRLQRGTDVWVCCYASVGSLVVLTWPSSGVTF
jgi:hypothetical protein